MLPALERELTNNRLISPGAVAAHARGLIERGGARYGVNLGEEVLAAMAAVDKFQFLKPAFKLIDERYNVGEEAAEYFAQDAIAGTGVPIWYEKGVVTPSTWLSVAARMVEAGLPEGNRDRILIAGSGCGYVPAVVTRLGYQQVMGVEINRGLAQLSRNSLTDLGYGQVKIVGANAYRWIDRQGLFDTILVFAGVKKPEVAARFRDHLRIGGRLVVPIGRDIRMLKRFTQRMGDKYEAESLVAVDFVPFIV